MKITVTESGVKSNELSYNEIISNNGVYKSLDDSSYKIIIIDKLHLFATDDRVELLNDKLWKSDKFVKCGPVNITFEN